MSVPYLMTNQSITVFVNGQSQTVDKTHPNFEAIKQAIKEQKFENIGDLFATISAVKRFCNGNIEVDETNDVLRYKGRELHGVLVNRILSMMSEGFEIKPLINFLNNLMENPSKRAVDELYSFLEVGNLPITEDGCFLAYKRVRHDYKDIYSGKIDNSVGAVVEMPRNMVDEDKDRTCSQGLHFCSLNYLPHYGDNVEGSRIMIVKINPRDVVAIPSDYNNTKGRTCRYEVVGEHVDYNQQSRVPAFTESVVYAGGNDQETEQQLHDSQDPQNQKPYNFYIGYEKGYKDGRARKQITLPVWWAKDFREGYEIGYRDGRNHKRKQYVTSEDALDLEEIL